MPRYVVVESEEETEQKTGRKTRAALAASTDSSMRRSTRIRHGSVNPDGSSPESVSDSVTIAPVTRVTRRRAAAAASAETKVSSEQAPRTLRSRKNSASSNISENFDVDSTPGTPKGRNRLSAIIEPSPSTPKSAAKIRRTARAASESISPAPVVRITRRTRATSIDPEPATVKVPAVSTLSTTVSTPTRRRRTQVSIVPSEPVVTEEDTNEDKNGIVQLSDDEEDSTQIRDNKSSTSSRKSSSTRVKKSSKNNSNKEQTEVGVDESFAPKLSEDSSASELSPPKRKSVNKQAEEPEVLKSTPKSQTKNSNVTDDNFDEDISPKASQSLTTKPKRRSSEKSKELGMKIEDLLNNSTAEQEKSPGNKENEKNNVSPQKIKKNLDFNVSNANIVRGKSLGSSKFPDNSAEKKLNISLDEQALFKTQSAYVAIKAIDSINKKVSNSSLEKKSHTKSPGIVESPKKNQETEDQSERTKTRTGYSKFDESIIANEVIEEFTLHDSDDSLDGCKNEFSLSVEDDVENENPSMSKKIDEEGLNKPNRSLDDNADLENHEDVFDPVEPEKENTRKSVSRTTEEMQTDEQLKEPEKENEAQDQVIQDNANTNKSYEVESMDTNEHEEPAPVENFIVLSPEKKSLDKSKDKDSKTDTSNQVSDSDSNIGIDKLFQNISAEEWNKRNSPNKKQVKDKVSSEIASELLEKANNEIDSDSDTTLILQTNNAARSSKRKHNKSPLKVVAEQVESDDTESNETTEQRKSLNLSNKLDESIQSSEKNDESKTTLTQSQEEIMEVDEDESDEDYIPTEAEIKQAENEAEEIEDIEKEIDELEKEIEEAEADIEKEEKEEEEGGESKSTKNTPKNKKIKTSAKSSAKSNQSIDIQELDASSETEKATDDEEGNVSINSKGENLEKPRVKPNRNYSTIALADSDSDSDGREDVTDSDCPSSDNSKQGLPGYLFNVESSEDEEEKSHEKEESNHTIDSDIARELNLAGDVDLQYSDDNVAADDCRDSESEHSDENDAGSDIGDFIVPDNEVESSEHSEEEEEEGFRFKRIVQKSSSEDEQDVEENTDKSLAEDVDEEKLSQLEKKKLNFSIDSEKGLSAKKTKKEKLIQESRDSVIAVSPCVMEPEPSVKKLKKFGKPLLLDLNSTIDLCTPVQSALPQTEDNTPNTSPSLNISLSKKSLKKLRKSLAGDLPSLTPESGSAKVETEEEDQLLATPKDVETPNKERKTPKSARKNQRDSLQLIAENCLVKSSVSDLNKSMSTPNSDTPITKFLKKETLNQSLPLLELKKRASRMFDKTELSNMDEDELEEESEQVDESEEQKEVAEDSEGEEENNEADGNGEEINANGHKDETEEEETDEEENRKEENGDEDEGTEKEDEDEEGEAEEESSEEEIVVEKKRNSLGKKSLSKAEDEEDGVTITRSKNQRRLSTDGIADEKYTKADMLSEKKNTLLKEQSISRKKRARLELDSSETPKSLRQTKKMKIAVKSSPAEKEDSDSDEAPESLGFGEARSDAMQAMKEVAASVRAGKEAKKKKRRDKLEKIRLEKEAKVVKKTTLKRLSDDVLQNISEVSERPKKKRKLSTKEKQILPSRYMYSPRKSNENSSWEIENCDSPLSTSAATIHFSVVNIEEVKKKPKKAAVVASFREIMLARNPRQPVSAFLMFQAKQKASGKTLSSRKQA